MTETIKYEAGAEIEARCAKCKAITQHKVLSLKKNGKVKTVHCAPCGYEHAYRLPSVKTASNKSPVIKLTAAEKKLVKINAEFDEMMEGVSLENSAPYDMNTSFNRDDIMEHPVFGLGKVEELITPDKVVVHFREGRKTLVCVISTEFEE